MIPKLLKKIMGKSKPRKSKKKVIIRNPKRKEVYDEFLLQRLKEEGFNPSQEYLEGKKAKGKEEIRNKKEQIKKEEVSAGIGILYTPDKKDQKKNE